MKYLKLLLWVAVGTLVILYSSSCCLKWLYQVKTEGMIELKNSRGVIRITRESDNMIPHIRAKDYESAVYG